jgi:hypothetical protein
MRLVSFVRALIESCALLEGMKERGGGGGGSVEGLVQVQVLRGELAGVERRAC